MLCLECGKREAKYDGLCEECFLRKVKFTSVPQHMDVVMCPHCHAIKFGAHWEHVPVSEAIERLVDKAIVLEHEYDSYSLSTEYGEVEGEFEVIATVQVKYEDIVVEEKHVITFHLKYESCPRCNRFFGNYFEAIIQLRGMRDNEVNEILDYAYERIEHHARKNENLFLTKDVEKREGWDLYLSDKREAKKIAREICHRYGASLKESPQIAGRKDGRDLYRVTYAVRFPPYRVGDVVEVEGEYYVVSEISDSFIRGTRIMDGKKKTVDSRRHRISVRVEKADVEEAIVVYTDGENVQILDRNNNVMDTKTQVPVEDGGVVKIARIDGEVYILPS